MRTWRGFPGSPGVKTAFAAKGPSSAPGQGTKIPQVTLCGQKKQHTHTQKVGPGEKAQGCRLGRA